MATLFMADPPLRRFKPSVAGLLRPKEFPFIDDEIRTGNKISIVSSTSDRSLAIPANPRKCAKKRTLP